MLTKHSSTWNIPAILLATMALVLGPTLGSTHLRVAAQESPSANDALPDVVEPSERSAESDAAASGDTSQDGSAAVAPSTDRSAASSSRMGGLTLFNLLRQGGWFFMVPIWVVSIAVVALTLERFISLRRGRVMPDGLVTGLGKLGGASGTFDPRLAYRLCQQFPSSASTVIRAMLLKVGRPHSEVEHAVREASDREANRLYTNVRWLSLAAAVAPLWGLLGTVWGMMMCFYDTTQLAAGQNKAEVLAEGIYTALVTTLCGLFIAIPSSILAHFFEGRIQEIFRQIDELLFNLLPQIERYEGRVRFNRQTTHEDGEREAAEAGSFVVGERTTASTPK